MSKFYITTPIYYVNGAPHIGHAYTTIVADAFARHYRQRGDDVFFLTGTDEHGLKIQRAAEEADMSPQALCDMNSAKFRDLFDQLELTHDRFIRTTDEDHKDTVLEMVEKMKASGDIYLDKYEGWYAASDEAYYDESEIEDGKAIATGSDVEWVEEPSYFFRLSNYEDALLDWYDQEPFTVEPKARRNEVRSFVDGGLDDLSISRTTFDWGIPMPDDPEHVLYVWVDALTNYISGVGGFDEAGNTGPYWPADIHLIGKDILRFHAVYWPAFLMSAGVEPPKEVFAHGWWMVEGEKMSKSKGNWLDAFDLAEQFDLDLLRYFLMREIPLGSDGNFDRKRLVERNNSELADNIGNLVNRVTKMAQGFIDGTTPEYEETNNEHDIELRASAEQAVDRVRDAMDKRETHTALEVVTGLAKDLNNYVQTTQPWKANKEENAQRVEDILYHALEGIRVVAVLSAAFIPDAAAEILASLGLDDDEALSFASVERFGGLPAGNDIVPPDVLFEKLDADEFELPTGAVGDEDTDVEDAAPEHEDEDDGMIEFNDFMDVEIRVGRIDTAEAVEGADKLLKLTATVGEDDTRTVVAGLAKSFEPSELEGKRVAMVTNLKPAKLFGIESQAMVLAAENEDGKLTLAEFSDDIAIGTRIK
jgi:methionyl-tRNA synthetase